MDFSAFRDELVKILEKRAGTAEKAVALATKHPKAALATLLASGAGVHHVGGTAVKDWETGRAYRKQMERSGR